MNKKLLNIVLITALIMLLFLPTLSKATEINMNLTNPNRNSNTNTNANTSTLPNIDVQTHNEISSNTIQQNVPDNSSIPETYSSTSSTIGTLSSLPEANLGLTNILSIILIVIGVLLILLAIAILIRLAH